MSVLDWGPPNHAAHTAGQVQREATPLHAPTAGRQRTPTLTPPQRDGTTEFLGALAPRLGAGWQVFMWREPFRERYGVRGRHECGFAIEHTVSDEVSSQKVLLASLAAGLAKKERRHSCEATRAAQS